MIETIKAQCFANAKGTITNAQLIAFINVANAFRINPLLPNMLYAYPNQAGIVPMLGPDGMFAILSGNPKVDYWETEIGEDAGGMWCTARIYCKDRSHPVIKRVWLVEWKMPSNPNWNTRPRHMLEIRALKQCARQIIHGIPYDEDEKKIMDQGGNLATGSTAEDLNKRIAAAVPVQDVSAATPEAASS